MGFLDPVFTVAWVVGIFLAVWIGATARAPFKQRDEARNALSLALDRAKTRDDLVPLSAIAFEIHRRDDILTENERWSDRHAKTLIVGLQMGSGPNPPDMPFNPSSPELRIRGDMDFVYGGIDWDKRRFIWRWKRADSKLGPLGVAFFPWEVDSNPTNFDLISGGASLDYLKSRTRFTWQLMTEIVDGLIGDGRLAVWARYGSPRSPFELIGPDQWRHFVVTDWEKAQARNPSGEVIYSIGLEPIADKTKVEA